MLFWLSGLTYLIVLALPLYYLRFNVLGIPTNLIEILILILFLGVLIGRSEKLGSLPLSGRGLILPIVLILGGLIIGALIAEDKLAAWGIIKGWFVVPIVFFWSILRLKDQINWRVITAIILVNINLVAVYALGQYGGLIPLLAHQTVGGDLGQYLEQGRALAFFESPNYLAMYLAPLIAFGAVLTVISRRWYQLLFLLLPLTALILSGSRAGILSVVAAVLISLVWRRLVNLTQKAAFVFVAVLLVGLAGWLTFRPESSDGLRLFIWEKAVGFIAGNPLLGIGPGQFESRFVSLAEQSPAFQFALPFALHPHNLYLNLWLSGGLLAIAGFVWLIARVFRNLRNNASTIKVAAASGLAAILIHGLFDTTYFKNDLAIIFWILAAAMVVGTDNELAEIKE